MMTFILRIIKPFSLLVLPLSLMTLRGAEHLQNSAFNSASKLSGEGGELADYVLGPHDKIEINLPLADELKKPIEVDSSGAVDIPFVGTVSVAGMTTRQLELDLDARLSPYFVAPHVIVNIVVYGSKSVSVFGAVRNPSVHQLQGSRTLVEILSESGGLAPDAGPKLTITRKVEAGTLSIRGSHLDATERFQIAEVDISALLSGEAGANIPLRAGDTITVPKAKLIYVMGDVHRPGGFPIPESGNATALQALALAEGLGVAASPQHARILRRREDQEREDIPVNLTRILEHKDRDVTLRPDDVLYVPNSKSKNAALRGIEAAIQLGTGVAIYHR